MHVGLGLQGSSRPFKVIRPLFQETMNSVLRIRFSLGRVALGGHKPLQRVSVLPPPNRFHPRGGDPTAVRRGRQCQTLWGSTSEPGLLLLAFAGILTVSGGWIPSTSGIPVGGNYSPRGAGRLALKLKQRRGAVRGGEAGHGVLGPHLSSADRYRYSEGSVTSECQTPCL